MYAEAIADRFSGNVQWLSERGFWTSFDAIVTRHRQTQTFTMRLKLLDAPHPSNRRKLSHRHRYVTTNEVVSRKDAKAQRKTAKQGVFSSLRLFFAFAPLREIFH